MNLQITTDAVAGTRAFADSADQVVRNVRRAVDAVEEFLDAAERIWVALRPAVRWFEAMLADRPAQVVVVSMSRQVG